MIKIIIFSKDRPLQLHLSLTSLIENFKIEKEIEVIYNYSNLEYCKAYEHLKSEFKSVNFNSETLNSDNFNGCLRNSVKTNKNFIMFLTDDNIFYRNCQLTEEDIRSVFSCDYKICSLSLRMGLNIKTRDGYQVNIPNVIKYNKLMFIWNRMNSLAGDYWNYPLSVDGHIFKTETITNIINDIERKIKNPNHFEQVLQMYFFEVGPYMAAPLLSNVVNSPNNRVQNYIENWFGRIFEVSQDELLYKFNEGQRIDLNKLDLTLIHCPHQEIDILKGLKNV